MLYIPVKTSLHIMSSTLQFASLIPLPMASFLHLALFLTLASQVSSDLAADRAECTDQLIGISTCLPYVGGEGKAPTPDCCVGFKQVMAKSVKCLCVLIKDRNDPQLGLKIDVNLALRLPSECNVPTNVSTCPSLLKLDPNSKVAKEFEQFENVLEGRSSINVESNSTATAATGVAHASDGTRTRFMHDGVWTWSINNLLVLVLLLVFRSY